MSDKYKEGNRVILTGKTLIPYPDWPVWGSKHSCVGTVVQIRRGFVHILWDNGYSKVVTPDSLSHYRGEENGTLCPNIAFMLHKRKVNEKNKKRR